MKTKYYVTDCMPQNFSLPKKNFLPTFSDPEDPRLAHWIKPLQDAENSLNSCHWPQTSWVLSGYPDDEGITLNGGRPGASQGPDAIRQIFYRLTPPWEKKVDLHSLHIFDVGNLSAAGHALEVRHKMAQQMGEAVMAKGLRLMTLGGGHDYGYADAAAFLKIYGSYHGRPLLINFDAHLDVRPLTHGFHSGTPFRRILEEFSDFDFLEIGLQAQCNSREHAEWAKSKGAHLLSLDQIILSGLTNPALSIIEFLKPFVTQPRPLFISFDLDAFSSAQAPGCSQSWPTGLTAHDVLMVLEYLAQTPVSLCGAGFYEVSPPFDVDHRTARLAALLAHRLLFFEKKL